MKQRVEQAEVSEPTTTTKDTDTDSEGQLRPFILDTLLTEEWGRGWNYK